MAEFLSYSECLRLSAINQEFQKLLEPVIKAKYDQIYPIFERLLEEHSQYRDLTMAEFSNTNYLFLSGYDNTTFPAGIQQIKNLERFFIYQYSFINEIPAEIFRLCNLDRLTISSCNIRHVSKKINFLSNLKFLTLENNQISEISEICQLANLVHLSLDRNQISQISPEIKKLVNLTRLSMNYNGITEIPPAFGELINLTSLSMSNNGITEIPLFLGKLSKLTELDLLDNPIHSVPLELGQKLSLEFFAVNEDVLPIPDNWPDYHAV